MGDLPPNMPMRVRTERLSEYAKSTLLESTLLSWAVVLDQIKYEGMPPDMVVQQGLVCLLDR